MQKSIKDLSDEEIEEILREAANSDISGGRYQQAFNEWRIRSERKLLNEQRDANAKLVRATQWTAGATIALAVFTAITLWQGSC